MKKDQIHEEIVPTLIILFFGLASFARMSLPDGTILKLLSKIIMSFSGVFGILYTMIKKISKDRLVFMLMLVTVMLISVTHTKNYDLRGFYLFVMYIGIGMLLVNFQLNYKLSFASFIFFAFYILFQILLIGKTSIFYDSSRNYHSIVIIYHLILLYIATHTSGRKISLFPAILTFLISILSVGRAGIIVSAFILLGVLTYIILEKDKEKFFPIRIKWLFIITLLIIVLMFTSLSIFENVYEKYFQRLHSQGLTDPARLTLIKEYLGNLQESFSNILLGVPIYGNKVFESYGNNLHNSYLRLHSNFGLIGFIAFAVLVVKAFFRYAKSNLLFFVLFSSILLRISTDQAAFHGIFDPLIYFFLLNDLNSNVSFENKKFYRDYRVA